MTTGTLKLNSCVVNGCTQIRFYETTGIYSGTNTGGYGDGSSGQNYPLSDYDSAILTITSPSNVVYTINLTAKGFPTNNVSHYYDLTSADLGGLTAIVDGKWTFKYDVTGSGPALSRTVYQLFYCNAECCVNEQLSDLDLADCGCNCDDANYNNYIKTWTFLQALKNASKCGDVTNFAKLQKIISKLCINTDCKTCK
jgi:hypothetical protein